MKLVILGDLQLVSPTEPMIEIRKKRKHFAEAWPSFQQIVAKVRQEAPDLVVCIGDLVDWYSEENRDFLVECMGQLHTPWAATPGNHDYSMYSWMEEERQFRYWSRGERQETADKGWKERGVVLDNRTMDTGQTNFIFMNSAFNDVVPGTREWLNTAINPDRANILFTHVPIDIPEMRDYILSVDPGRNLDKYVQSNSPWLFDECVKGRIKHVYSGHLHLPGRIELYGTTMHLLGLSTVSVGQVYPGMGEITVIQVK